MSARRLAVRMIRLLLIVAVPMILVTGMDALFLLELAHFAERESFSSAIDPDYPQPSQMPAVLSTYVDFWYERSPRVRRTVARYYIRWDRVCVDRLLISAGGGPSHSIPGLLWDHECSRQPALDECCSMSLMRGHMLDHSKWLGLSADEIKTLQSHDDILNRLLQNTSSSDPEE